MKNMNMNLLNDAALENVTGGAVIGGLAVVNASLVMNNLNAIIGISNEKNEKLTKVMKSKNLRAVLNQDKPYLLA